MNLFDVVSIMPGFDLITVEDFKKGEILIDRDTPDRICAFGEVDKKIHKLLHKSQVCNIEVGKVYNDLIISVVVTE